MLPDGATRDLAALKEGRARGQALLSAEHYEVLGTIADGDYVALELRWTEFHNGRITRQRNYDCFDPW